MKRYKVFDINKGLLVEPIIVEANNPIEAVKAAGYKEKPPFAEIARDYSGRCGNIVVYGPRGSYVYWAEAKEARA